MIPVTFNLNNKRLTGYLSLVQGSGQPTWHLMVDNYFYGYLIKVNNGYAFHSNQYPELKELADYFGEVVQAAG